MYTAHIHVYRHTPHDERICTYCNLGQVEDEVHLVTSCELFSDLRTTWAESHNIDMTMDNKTELFIQIYTNLPTKTFAQYIISAMQRRRIT